jgi:hypothetical protein
LGGWPFRADAVVLENPNLAGWAGHEERLAYYRGHRDGRRAREMLADGEQTA